MQGHSRTIVGIEVRRDGGALDQHLLILDPIRRTAAIKTALRSNTGWQQMLKCGEGTLNLAEYQILCNPPPPPPLPGARARVLGRLYCLTLPRHASGAPP